MYKTLLTIFTIIILTFVSQAQTKFGVTGGLGFTAGGPAIGGSAHLRHRANSKILVGFNVGYYFYPIKNYYGALFGVGIIPITGSFEYMFIDKGFKPYIGSDLGISIISLGSKSTSGYALAPTIGFYYEIFENLDLNFNIKYNYILIPYDSNLNGAYFGQNVGVLYTF